MESKIQAVVDAFRTVDESEYESLRTQLIALAKDYGVSNMVTFLESANDGKIGSSVGT